MGKNPWAKIRLENEILKKIIRLLTTEELEQLKKRERASNDLSLRGSTLNYLDTTIAAKNLL